ncbi:MAG: GGDEF domain-containing protein, partial [Campylobacterota bacterium]|nr:GGDEF domain-containing protein [Campylobacterota bacterium]
VYRNEAEAIEKYHRLLYTDPLTNLKNRKFFSLSLKSYLHSDNRFSNGFIMLLETGGSSQTERSHDDYTQRLQAAARAIEDVTQDEPYTVTCHSRKSEFALILPSYSKEDARSKADTLYASLQQEQFEKINITLTPYHYRESVETILSRADYALNVSISKEASGITFYAEDEAEQEMPIGHDAWAREIQAGLDEKRFVERLQPTVDVHNRIVRQELLLRLVKGSEQLSAHHFMPVIMNLGWMSKIDQYVIEKIITHREDYQPLSINISLDFIRQSSMLHWLKETLQRMPNRPNICFEISNSSLLQDQGACLEFIKIVRSLECGIGLDHFMLGKADLTYLRAIKPDYLKIDADYLLTILESQGGGLTNRSLYTIASMLDIAIIALGIDSEELLERLKANGVSFFQGYYIDKQLYDGEEDE